MGVAAGGSSTTFWFKISVTKSNAILCFRSKGKQSTNLFFLNITAMIFFVKSVVSRLLGHITFLKRAHAHVAKKSFAPFAAVLRTVKRHVILTFCSVFLHQFKPFAAWFIVYLYILQCPIYVMRASRQKQVQRLVNSFHAISTFAKKFRLPEWSAWLHLSHSLKGLFWCRSATKKRNATTTSALYKRLKRVELKGVWRVCLFITLSEYNKMLNVSLTF